jgi:hypothetical protein
MSTLEKHARYRDLWLQTERTVELLEAAGMKTQADRHRECAALLACLTIRYGGSL